MDRELYLFPRYGCYVVRWMADLSKQGMQEHWRDIVDHPEVRPGYAALLELKDALVSYSEQEAKESVGLPADFRLPYRS